MVIGYAHYDDFVLVRLPATADWRLCDLPSWARKLSDRQFDGKRVAVSFACAGGDYWSFSKSELIPAVEKILMAPAALEHMTVEDEPQRNVFRIGTNN